MILPGERRRSTRFEEMEKGQGLMKRQKTPRNQTLLQPSKPKTLKTIKSLKRLSQVYQSGNRSKPIQLYYRYDQRNRTSSAVQKATFTHL